MIFSLKKSFSRNLCIFFAENFGFERRFNFVSSKSVRYDLKLLIKEEVNHGEQYLKFHASITATKGFDLSFLSDFHYFKHNPLERPLTDLNFHILILTQDWQLSPKLNPWFLWYRSHLILKFQVISYWFWRYKFECSFETEVFPQWKCINSLKMTFLEKKSYLFKFKIFLSKFNKNTLNNIVYALAKYYKF